MPTTFAGGTEIWVCHACGKRSRDQLGEEKIDAGWDESCMLNAVLCYASSLVIENGRVVKATAVPKLESIMITGSITV